MPQTKISISAIKKCGRFRLWDLDSIVVEFMCKLQCILAAVEFKLIKLLRQRNLNSSELVCDGVNS